MTNSIILYGEKSSQLLNRVVDYLLKRTHSLHF